MSYNKLSSFIAQSFNIYVYTCMYSKFSSIQFNSTLLHRFAMCFYKEAWRRIISFYNDNICTSNIHESSFWKNYDISRAGPTRASRHETGACAGTPDARNVAPPPATTPCLEACNPPVRIRSIHTLIYTCQSAYHNFCAHSLRGRVLLL